MQLNASCFAHKSVAYGEAGILTSISDADRAIDGAAALSDIGTLHTTIDDRASVGGAQATSKVHAFRFETKVSVLGVEAQGYAGDLRIASANIIASFVRLFGVGARGQTNTLRSATTNATTYDVMVVIAA